MTSDILKDLKTVMPDILPFDVEEEIRNGKIFGAQLNEMPFEGSFVAIAKSDKTIQQPPVNKIFRSALYEAWGPARKAPSRLTPFINAE
jgi:hypothetical protein